MRLENMFNAEGQPKLCCPDCGFDYVHIRNVIVTATTNDGYDVADVFSARGSLHRRVGDAGEQVDTRQGLTEIIADGECECPSFRVAFGQHKGQVLVRWELIEQSEKESTA